MDIALLKRIAPKSDFRKTMDIDDMLLHLPLLIVRRSEGEVKEMDSPKGKRLCEECLGKDIFNYSTNLLGGLFDVSEHLNIKQTGEGKLEWDGLHVLTDEKILECSEIAEGEAIFFEVKDLHLKEIPYCKKFAKKKDYDETVIKAASLGNEAAFSAWVSCDEEVNIKGKMKANHAPTFLNYWHITLDIYSPEKEELLNSGKNGWKKEIRGFVFNFLCTNYSLVKPESYVIPEDFYKK